jgi:hypothetical protein
MHRSIDNYRQSAGRGVIHRLFSPVADKRATGQLLSPKVTTKEGVIMVNVHPKQRIVIGAFILIIGAVLLYLVSLLAHDVFIAFENIHMAERQ